MGLSVETPIILHTLPTMNSPSINPRKNGMAWRWTLMPPVFRMIHFAKQLSIMENQKTFIDQLLETAYPAGWNGHQKNRVRPNQITIENTKLAPMTESPDESTDLGC